MEDIMIRSGLPGTAYALDNVGFVELRKLYVESDINLVVSIFLIFSVIHLIIY